MDLVASYEALASDCCLEVIARCQVEIAEMYVANSYLLVHNEKGSYKLCLKGL